MAILVILAQFTRNGGLPATGLTLADIDLYLTAVNRTTGVDTVIWGGAQNPTFEVDNVGQYGRIYSAADFDTYIYSARATYTGAVVLDVDHCTGAVPEVSPWSYGVRTLSQSAAQVAAVLAGSVITVYKGTTWSISFADLGSLENRTALYWTVKKRTQDADADAVVQIEETAGLLYINGAAATVAGNGTLTVTDEVNGDLTITLAVTEADKLGEKQNLVYDLKIVKPTGVSLVTIGRMNIGMPATGAVA